MAKRITPIKCDRIVERHAALGRTEVALVVDRCDETKLPWYVVELITAKDDGSYVRDAISDLFPTRAALESRLMDFHAGVVNAQRALGMSIDRQFA